MSEVVSESNRKAPRRARFRVGLKALFAVMTLLCLWLGWRMARQRQAAAIVARSQTILDGIESNMTTVPQGASFTISSNLRQRKSSFLKKTRRDPSDLTNQLGGISSNGRFYTSAIRGEPLDITNLLATKSAADASLQIRSHYEQGLKKIGLRRTVTTNSVEKATAIWQMPEHGLHVIIDVDADAARKQADVRIIYLHSESLSFW